MWVGSEENPAKEGVRIVPKDGSSHSKVCKGKGAIRKGEDSWFCDGCEIPVEIVKEK
jgi:hypothetical protein